MKFRGTDQNFPGQFRHMAAEWAETRPGYEVIAIGRDTAPSLPEVPGIKMLEVPTVNNQVIIRAAGCGMGYLPQINNDADEIEYLWRVRIDRKIK